MTDLVFGELVECENLGCYGGWRGNQVISFGGNPCSLKILIQQSEEEGGITKLQYEAYQSFMERWPYIQPKMIEALIQYYNEEERFAWGRMMRKSVRNGGQRLKQKKLCYRR